MSQFEYEGGAEYGAADGVESEHPFAHDPEFAADLDRYLEEKTAPLRQFAESWSQGEALAYGEEQADELLASAAAKAGVEIDQAEARASIDASFLEAAQLMEAQGMSPAEVSARLLTPEAAEIAVRVFVEQIVREQSTRGGDELDLVKKYFPTARDRSAERLPRSAEQQAVIDQAMKRA